MRISMGLRAVLLVSVVLVVVLVLGGASVSAGAVESAWWHVTAGPVPTHIDPASARDEVLELKVNATGGDVGWLSASNPFKEFVVFPYNASHEEVQGALEKFYGVGGVEVVGGPREKTPGQVVTELEPYVVKFVGPLAGRPVALPLEAFTLACVVDGEVECLQPEGEGNASVLETTKGSAAGEIVVTATNLGDAPVDGEAEPVTVSDALPAGFQAVGVYGVALQGTAQEAALKCSLEGEGAGSSPACSFGGKVYPYTALTLHLQVDATGAKDGEEERASVSGGGTRPLSVSRRIPLGESTPFGVADYELVNEEEGGGADTQAGSHPFQQTTTVVLNQTVNANGYVEPAELPKDLHFAWPPGLLGNPTPLPQCPLTVFLSEGHCPADTAVGVAKVLLTFNQGAGPQTLVAIVPLFNLVPSPGEPARLGFRPSGVPVYVDPSVRSGRDYGLTINTENISELAGFRSAEVTAWGVPGDSSHDQSRGAECLAAEKKGESCAPARVENPEAFISLPTGCPVNQATGQPEPLVSTVTGDSWAQPKPAENQSLLAEYVMPALDGCDALPFGPSISVAPDGQQGSTPTGLSVAIHVPQEETLAPGGLAGAAVKDTTVALPVGVQLSPAAADGLLSCSTAQVGYTGLDPLSGAAQFTPGAVECASASKVGTVVVRTPLLPEPLEGGVYLATQDQNPFGSLVALYLFAESAREGVTVKLPGEIKLDERTGQIVATFPNSPEVPFEEARLHFFGGNRAPLSTPPLCGSYTSTASITPWSISEPSSATSTFEITGGPSGSPCQSPRPFQPGFQAGTTSVQAGGYSPLTLTMSRPDADQPLGKLAVVFPPGISAGLRGVKLCEEPRAAQGTCPAESQIGQVTASAGLAGDPFPVETGKAYITGPYEGDPFGVEIVVPAIAGPFNLGTEIVRSKVNVDPTDAHLTVVSDPFPTILDGIPLQLQHVNVTVDRPGFVFNPTSCEPMKLTGELESTEGATANVATPFQVTNCAALSFKPEFNVQTSAHTSRTEGASLHVTLTLPNGAQGTKANVAKVRVSLPKQLPSPLKTLQKACTEKVFAENPTSCPKASRVGEATVGTPVLEGPLSGPAYFVSHGGAKYPELIIVLTGEDGVTVQVHGETFISKQGITTATFSTVPDVPFSTFELTLPKREYPALTANGNLCRGSLIMPAEFVAQNGLKISQETKIAVTGCGKAKRAGHKKQRSKRKRKKA